MPSWLIELLVTLAAKVGIPYLTEKLNWVPKEFWAIVQDVLSHIKSQPDKTAAVQSVRAQLQCAGIGCAPELKGTK